MQRNRHKLVTAAREAFNEQGPQTSLEEIARRAGVGATTLYRHFADKDDLVRRTVHHSTPASRGPAPRHHRRRHRDVHPDDRRRRRPCRSGEGRTGPARRIDPSHDGSSPARRKKVRAGS
ncbi:TetR/AcrR family transcriptional regulator [Mycobacterium simiae]|uniref:TetR/AcrR family transcriptional regulator n=1 Tax=Mycobacterium simiae TaxID=1784 RepID=UPI001E53BF3D|nr:helix-turn-helix domain-containing protein [Mycobacterium simiae]